MTMSGLNREQREARRRRGDDAREAQQMAELERRNIERHRLRRVERGKQSPGLTRDLVSQRGW